MWDTGACACNHIKDSVKPALCYQHVGVSEIVTQKETGWDSVTQNQLQKGIMAPRRTKTNPENTSTTS